MPGLPVSHLMKQARILIVEDELIVAADIAIRLTQLGYQVVGTAVSGEEALALAASEGPDLVLMDIHLLGAMDGIEAAKVLRESLVLPVVFLTAYSGGATIQRAKEAEPMGYILKPFEDHELEIVIEISLYKHHSEQVLKEKYAEIDRFNKVTEGRELRMIELKREVNALLRASGQAEKYVIVDE